jgi:hypothetical protein
MIPLALLSTLAEKLSTFRGDGRSLVLFDGRNQGNYSNFYWDETSAMLNKADPTGFSLAMLINEMIEATIDGSTVKLNRILREEGFIAKLAVILDYKESLMEVLEAPMQTFMARIESIINAVSPDFGAPSSLEVALCMRDAIYCIDKGMTMRWIQCEPGFENHAIGLQPDIVIAPTIAQFVEDLKYALPNGVHLARIGHDDTAIGIKKPCRILYMSSLKMNLYTGSMKQEAHGSENLGEKFDLDGFAHRYPRWINKSWVASHANHTDAKMLQVADIGRDSIIWLVMMMELASQEMGRVDPDTIRLSESARLALSHDSIERRTMPVPYKPNWTLEAPSLMDMVAGLGLSPWELKFVAQALEGVDPLAFMPVTNKAVGMSLAQKKLIDMPESRSNLDEHNDANKVIRFVSIDEGIAGTEDEIRKFVTTIYRTNLADYLITFGNQKFMTLWKQDTEWFKATLTANAMAALDAPCTKVHRLDFSRWSIPSIYKQSPKHKGFRPLCFIKGKGECDVKSHVYPVNDQEMADVLGLSSVSDLPEYLHGWSRKLSWATGSGVTQQNPALSQVRWFFGVDDDDHSDEPHSAYEAFIYFDSANHPTGANKPRW